MATGTIKKLMPKSGIFRTHLTANTYTTITTSILVDGTLPANPQNTIFKVYVASNNNHYRTEVYSESNDIYGWTDTEQDYVVKWYEFSY